VPLTIATNGTYLAFVPVEKEIEKR
jgi:hypothetical protein